MKKLSLFLLGLSVLVSCNEDPDMVQENRPIPVIYAVINKYDPVNFIYLTRTFSSDPYGADINARIWDSVYFKDITVTAGFINNIDTISVTPVSEVRTDKDPGNFAAPSYPVYVLYADISGYNSMALQVNIPGYSVLNFKIRLLNQTKMVFPKREGTQITLLPDQSFVSVWDPDGSWSDMILRMTIETRTTTGVFMDTLEFAQYAAVRFDPDYDALPVRKASFSYGNFLSLLNSNLSCNSDIMWRRIDDISIRIITSPTYFPILPTSELNLSPYDIIKRDSKKNIMALGVISSRVSIGINGLKFDYSSVRYMQNDTTLQKFKIVF
jgi:hypothetical protein